MALAGLAERLLVGRPVERVSEGLAGVATAAETLVRTMERALEK